MFHAAFICFILVFMHDLNLDLFAYIGSIISKFTSGPLFRQTEFLIVRVNCMYTFVKRYYGAFLEQVSRF